MKIPWNGYGIFSTLLAWITLVQSQSNPSIRFRRYELSASPYLTARNSNFNSHIEGLNVAPSGRIYAVQYGRGSNALGQLYPIQNTFFIDKNQNSYFNGMHFLNASMAFAVDSSDNTRLLQIELDRNGVVIRSKTHCQEPSMLPLNDLAISFKTGEIYLSAMNWTNTSTDRDGQIWVCSPQGHAKLLDVMGGVNGIELSLDEQTLFATESFTRNWTHISSKIWKYNVDPEQRIITKKQLFVDMARVPGDSVGFAMDGIKTDASGHLLAVRYGGSTVAVFSHKGDLLGRIHLSFKNPTNLELGELGGRKYLLICGACSSGGVEGVKGCVDSVPWPWNGRSWHNFRQLKNI